MLKPLKETEIIKRYSKPTEPDNIKSFPYNPLDVPEDVFLRGLQRRQQNQAELHRWVKENLRPDIDFGAIHLVENCQYAKAGNPHQCSDLSHWSMPVLFKPGAERIIGVLGLTVFFPNLKQYEMSCAHEQKITEIVLKCELRTQTGKVACEGVGGRHLSQDNCNINKSLKMCAKSAMIDAVIRVGGLSCLFSTTWNYNLTHMGECNNYNLQPQANSFCNQSNYNTSPKPISKKQLELILNIAGKKGLTSDALNKQCKSLFNKDFKQIDRCDASRLIQHLKG